MDFISGLIDKIIEDFYKNKRKLQLEVISGIIGLSVEQLNDDNIKKLNIRIEKDCFDSSKEYLYIDDKLIGKFYLENKSGDIALMFRNYNKNNDSKKI